MRHFAAFTLVISMLTLSSPPAFAGGFEYGTDLGTVALARAGASTAYPNLMSVYTNVAGIADTPRMDFYLTTHLTFRSLLFQRMDEDGTEYDPYEDQQPIFANPSFAAHFRLTSFLVLGIGFNGPASIGSSEFPTTDRSSQDNYDTSAPGRYDVSTMNIIYVFPSIGLGFSFPFYRNLRIGATFQPTFINVQTSNYVRLIASEFYEAEIRADLDVWDPFIPAGSFGVMWKIWRLELGAQVRISGSIEAEGDAIVTYQSDDEDPEVDEDWPNDGVRFNFNWPSTVARFGIRYGHPRRNGDPDSMLPHKRERFDLELDFIFENNSSMEAFNIEILNLQPSVGATQNRQFSIAHNWNNTYSVRFGGAVHLLRGMLSVYYGFSWESETVPLEYTRVDYAGWMRFGLAFGLTFRISIIELSAAYQHIFMPDRDVAVGTGQAFQLEGFNGGTSENVINEGHYEAGYDFFSLSLAVRLGVPDDEDRDEDDEEEEEPIAEDGTVEEPYIETD